MNRPSNPVIARNYGLDWLRIGAFALLILFHICLYFGPGHWIVKSPREVAWVAWPVAAIVPWRLTVLFAVSGFATAAMMQRYATLGGFLAERTRRLLVPLLFGMLAIVPPQDWVRLQAEGGAGSYADFLLRDCFSFSLHGATFLPNWEHLWFLPWLWLYTLGLAAAMALVPVRRDRLDRALGWLAGGRRLLYLPAALILCGMAAARALHRPELVESADYLPAFLFGVAYAHFPALRAANARLFGEAAAISLASLAVTWWRLAFPAEVPTALDQLVDLGVGTLLSWPMLMVMFRLAERFLDFDHPLRQPLAAAVFPAYIVHQTIIVVVGWELTRAGIAGLPAALVQVAAVVGGCFAAWWLARSSPLAGVLLGMPPRRDRARPQVATEGEALPLKS